MRDLSVAGDVRTVTLLVDVFRSTVPNEAKRDVILGV